MDAYTNKASTNKACYKCGEIMDITCATIKMEEIHQSGNEEIYKLMYCECPRCKAVNPLQIDNNVTEGIKSNLLKLIDKRAKYGVLSAKENQKAKTFNKKLDEKRKELETWAEGQEFLDVEGNIFTNCLTFGKE